ncbi:MAG: hypothetical protein MZU97_23560 [Bacillus subtilis]|nr:hypothetical protein [Bacillus subtilis]
MGGGNHRRRPLHGEARPKRNYATVSSWRGVFHPRERRFLMYLLDNITQSIPAKVVIPVYSLAPNATFEVAYSELLGVHKTLLESSNKIIAIGGFRRRRTGRQDSPMNAPNKAFACLRG